MNSADTAGNAATAAAGETPMSSAVGMRALVVAACEYSSADASPSTTASIHGKSVRTSEAAFMMDSSCALTNVVPSHATPSTQIAALMQDLKVEAPRISAVGTLHASTMIAAMPSMIAMIAASRAMTGSAMRPTLSEISVA